MKENPVLRLTSKDNNDAYAYAEKIIAESRETDTWYEYFDSFVPLLDHRNSLVRNRALHILAANVQWDEENRFDDVLSSFLNHVTDNTPVTARQCIKALAEVGSAKPRYIPQILACFENADFSKYKDSMRPLIERDIYETRSILTEKQSG